MAGFEDLIRDALVKQGDATAEGREQIYESAKQALDRMIASNQTLEPSVVEMQRGKLERAVTRIEAEYKANDLESESKAIPEPSTPEKLPEKNPAVEAPIAQTQPEPIPEIELPIEAEFATVVTTPEPDVVPEVIPKIPLSSPPPSAQPSKEPVLDDPAPLLKISRQSASESVFDAESSTIELDEDLEPEISEILQPPQKPVPVAEPQPVSTVKVETTSQEPEPERIANVAPPPAEPSIPTIPGPAEVKPPQQRVEPLVEDPVRLEEEPSAPEIYHETYSGNALQERKPYAKLLLWSIILAGIGMACWWAWNFGPALLKAQLNGSVPNPRATIESGGFVPGETDPNGWITVFVPDASAENVVPKGGAFAELARVGSRQVMRVASPSGSLENNVQIKVPRAVMEKLKGQAGTFEVMVSTVVAENQEFALYCEFAAMGNCGRKRFTAGGNAEPFIFDVLVNDIALAAGEDAYISLNTDFSGEGRSLDLYSIRVRPGT